MPDTLIYASALSWALIGFLAVWELAWKGFALWHAAQNGHKRWFIAMLVINSIGILPILYIYVYSQQSNKLKLVVNGPSRKESGHSNRR